jgi:hypothetical protein
MKGDVIKPRDYDFDPSNERDQGIASWHHLIDHGFNNHHRVS